MEQFKNNLKSVTQIKRIEGGVRNFIVAHSVRK